MNKKIFVESERKFTIDLLKKLPRPKWQATTLCKGWTVEDLATHLVVRERHPLNDLGLIAPRFMNSHNNKIKSLESNGHKYIIEKLSHYPWWMPASLNVAEFWVHNEDFLRGSLKMSRPKPSKDVENLLWGALKGLVKINKPMLAALGSVIIANDLNDDRITVENRNSDKVVTLSGTAGELLLYCFGRRAAAKVKIKHKSA